MKACRLMKIMVASIFGLLIAAPNLSFGQDEYDDLYFTPKDRKEVKYEPDYNFNEKSVSDYDQQTVAKNTTTGDVINPTYSPSAYGDLEENYSSKNVNPEYIARYKSNPKEVSSEEIVAEGDSYYEEDYLRTDLSDKATLESSTNSYSYPSSFYGACDPRMRSSMYGSSFYDPFMGGGFAPGWNVGLGYSFGYMPGFNMSISYGSGYNPWYNPFYSGMSRFYNPFYSPWAYDPMYSAMRYGYGGPGYYNPYGMYYNDPYGMYNSGLYSGYGSSSPYSGGVKRAVTTPSNQNMGLQNPVYRNRVSRGSDVYEGDDNVINKRRASQDRISAQDNESTVNARTASYKDYSTSQNEYYNSRTASRNGNTTYASSRSTDRSALNPRNVSGNTIGTSTSTSSRVRSSRNTSSDYSRPSYRSAKSSTNSYNSSGRSSSLSNSYNRSKSSGGSSSYSSGSSSRSSGSSFRSSGGSSSGSRSSGSSSGGGSRSSGSGGGSRSSGRGN